MVLIRGQIYPKLGAISGKTVIIQGVIYPVVGIKSVTGSVDMLLQGTAPNINVQAGNPSLTEFTLIFQETATSIDFHFDSATLGQLNKLYMGTGITFNGKPASLSITQLSGTTLDGMSSNSVSILFQAIAPSLDTQAGNPDLLMGVGIAFNGLISSLEMEAGLTDLVMGYGLDLNGLIAEQITDAVPADLIMGYGMELLGALAETNLEAGMSRILIFIDKPYTGELHGYVERKHGATFLEIDKQAGYVERRTILEVKG